MYIHTDELIFDPLPQPYRYINKILLHCVEDAIDLAEGGGSPESLNSIVSHNLRLTKVGKLPTEQMENFFFSTAICNHEVSIYTMLGNTQFLLTGTSQGNLMIYDPLTQAPVFTLAITTLSKFASQRPITHLLGFETDHSHYIVAFATEDVSFLLFLSTAFVTKATIELDMSPFSIDSLIFSTCAQPYLIATDGTGRTAIYNCHTTPELVPAEGATGPVAAKAAPSRPIQLDPVLEVERCPISTGPVSSDSHFAQRTEDPASRKKQPKKKPAPPPKGGKGRAKSPGTTAVENASTVETTRYHAVAHVFELNQVVIIRFGTFPIILVYSIKPPNPILNELPLPSPVSAALELNDENHIVLGLENGSFCFLDVARRTIHDHRFPRQGLIKSILSSEGMLYTFAQSKAITAYPIANLQAGDPVFTCSDDDILDTHVIGQMILTFNQKSSDSTIIQALVNTTKLEERDMEFFPNISVIEPGKSRYLGTAALPVNLQVMQMLWNTRYVIFIFNDPVDYRAASPDRGASPVHAKRAPSPKGGKPTPPPKKGKAAPRGKKAEDVKEPEPEATVLLKRQIVGFLDLETVTNNFREIQDRIDEEKRRRREKAAIAKSPSTATPEGEEPAPIPEGEAPAPVPEGEPPAQPA
jgi:hypothetical protein